MFNWGGGSNKSRMKKYYKLYNKLLGEQEIINNKLKALNEDMEAYISGMPDIAEEYIPDDDFKISEESVRSQVLSVKEVLNSDSTKIQPAIDEAWQRYEYYYDLVEEERQRSNEEGKYK